MPFWYTKFQKDLLPHPPPRGHFAPSLWPPRWKFLATPVVMIKCEVVRFKKVNINCIINVNCIIMILTTVIRNIYIIFIPWVKQSFPNYEDFSHQRNIPKVCMKSYDRKHQNKKLPTVGGGKTPLPHPPPPPPPPSLASLVRAWSLRSLACPPRPWRGMPGTPLPTYIIRQ